VDLPLGTADAVANSIVGIQNVNGSQGNDLIIGALATPLGIVANRGQSATGSKPCHEAVGLYSCGRRCHKVVCHTVLGLDSC
jgi:hypothetical protein